MRISHLFTIRKNCFLPLGDIESVISIMNQDLRVFWDGSWTFEGRATRSLVFFCEKYHRGYKPRRAFSSISPPNLFMFSPDDRREIICDLLLYPGDKLFQDHQTTVLCTGMLPLSLKKKISHQRIDAQLLNVSLSDYRIQMDFCVLLWLHPTSDVFTILGEHKPRISFYWEKNLYRYRQERTYTSSLFAQHSIFPQYYISSRGLKEHTKITSFYGDMMYRYRRK